MNLPRVKNPVYPLLLLLALMYSAVVSAKPGSRKDSLENVLKKKDLPDSTRMGILYDLALSYLYNSDDTTLLYTERAIALAKKLDNRKLMSDAYSLQGVVYKNKGDYSTAIRKHLSSLEYHEKAKDSLGCAICYNDIGILYKQMKNYPKAMEYYQLTRKFLEGLKANKESNPKKIGMGLSMSLNNIGTVFLSMGRQDSAYAYYIKALAIAEEIKNNYALVTAYSNLGELFGMQDKPKEALQYFEKCLAIDIQNNDRYGMMLSYTNVGTSHKELGNFELAEKNFLKAEELGIENDAKPQLKDLYNAMAECYRLSKKPEKAYEYLLKYTQLKDTILNEETTRQIADAQTRFETEKKDLEIARQQAEITASKAEVDRKNILTGILLGSIVLLVVLSWLFYNRYKLKQKDILNEEIIRQQAIRSKAVIDAEEKERIRIAQDLHDGVGQMLSAAKLNLGGVESKLNLAETETQVMFKNAIDLVNDSVKEVRAVSHNMMPNALLKSGLAAAVREFINKLSAVEQLKIDLEITGMNERLEQTRETVLFRILQEIVSNIIKHAQASHISIQLIRHETEVNLMVEDNGIGFDTSRINEHSGIGLRNIQSRVEFLGGTVHFDSTPGKGTSVVIDVPLA